MVLQIKNRSNRQPNLKCGMPSIMLSIFDKTQMLRCRNYVLNML